MDLVRAQQLTGAQERHVVGDPIAPVTHVGAPAQVDGPHLTRPVERFALGREGDPRLVVPGPTPPRLAQPRPRRHRHGGRRLLLAPPSTEGRQPIGGLRDRKRCLEVHDLDHTFTGVGHLVIHLDQTTRSDREPGAQHQTVRGRREDDTGPVVRMVDAGDSPTREHRTTVPSKQQSRTPGPAITLLRQQRQPPGGVQRGGSRLSRRPTWRARKAKVSAVSAPRSAPQCSTAGRPTSGTERTTEEPSLASATYRALGVTTRPPPRP